MWEDGFATSSAAPELGLTSEKSEMTVSFSLFEDNPHAPPQVGLRRHAPDRTPDGSMFPCRKEEALRNLVAGSLPTYSFTSGTQGCHRGRCGVGSRLPINNLIKPPRVHGSRWRAAMAAMLTCGDFRNEKRVGFFYQ